MTATKPFTWRDVQGWFSFVNLYQRIVDNLPDPAHIVEVGCWKGKSAIFLAEAIRASGKRVTLDCVDIWTNDLHTKHLTDIPDLFQHFLDNITRAGVRDLIHVTRMDSTAAADLYQDASLDFVFIDADHETEKVTADVRAWLPKVKPGGVLAGHDWDSFGVTPGVLAVLPREKLEILEGGYEGKRTRANCWVYPVPRE